MTRDEFIHEKVRGLCWHIPVGTSTGMEYICNKCRISLKSHITKKANSDYSSPSGWWKLWEWSKNQEWWHKFLMDKWGFCNPLNSYINLSLVDLQTFPDAIAKFHGWKGNGR
jgi:hypothetical protein